MRRVGVKLLKNHLSEYVRATREGETTVITDRGSAVARLIPAEPHRNESVIERGIREGWIRQAVRRPNWPPQGKPVPGLTLEKLLADLDRDREDR
jgi:prevent-host-death family protein